MRVPVLLLRYCTLPTAHLWNCTLDSRAVLLDSNEMPNIAFQALACLESSRSFEFVYALESTCIAETLPCLSLPQQSGEGSEGHSRTGRDRTSCSCLLHRGCHGARRTCSPLQLTTPQRIRLFILSLGPLVILFSLFSPFLVLSFPLTQPQSPLFWICSSPFLSFGNLHPTRLLSQPYTTLNTPRFLLHCRCSSSAAKHGNLSLVHEVCHAGFHQLPCPHDSLCLNSQWLLPDQLETAQVRQ